MGELIYLVCEQSSFFGFSSSSNQYLSYESRSSWLLWLLSAIASPPLCLYQSLSLSFLLYFLSLVLYLCLLPLFSCLFFPSSALTACLIPPTLPLLKNYSAHLDRALNGRYTISPRVELIKNRSEYWLRISQDFPSFSLRRLSPLYLHPKLYWLKLKMYVKSENLAVVFFSPSLSLSLSAQSFV